MEKAEFKSLLEKSSINSYEFAKDYLVNDLPKIFKYTLQFNDIKEAELKSELEVVDLLFRNGEVPVWIDISVDTVYKKFTVFRLLYSDRYSGDIEELYYYKRGTGPFGIKSPNLPLYFKEGDKFDITKRKRDLFFARLRLRLENFKRKYNI